MSVLNHLKELERKHAEIERELASANTHPSIDDLELTALKRRKLAVKEQIEKLKSSMDA